MRRDAPRTVRATDRDNGVIVWLRVSAGRCGGSCCARAERVAKWAAAGERRPEFEVWVMDAPRGRCVERAFAQFAKRIVTIALPCTSPERRRSDGRDNGVIIWLRVSAGSCGRSCCWA